MYLRYVTALCSPRTPTSWRALPGRLYSRWQVSVTGLCRKLSSRQASTSSANVPARPRSPSAPTQGPRPATSGTRTASPSSCSNGAGAGHPNGDWEVVLKITKVEAIPVSYPEPNDFVGPVLKNWIMAYLPPKFDVSTAYKHTRYPPSPAAAITSRRSGRSAATAERSPSPPKPWGPVPREAMERRAPLWS